MSWTDSGGASAPSRVCCHGAGCVQHGTFGGPARLSRFNSGPDCHACAAAGLPAKRPSLSGPDAELFGEVYVICADCGKAREVARVKGMTFERLDRFYVESPVCMSCRQNRGFSPAAPLNA